MPADRIVIRGAKQHNLKNVDLDIPKHRLVVITGVSGSGKSSLALDTLYAEGQRRYVESLSAYARQFLEQMGKPKVDYVGGLSPAVAIEQKRVGRSPRSTVGTITEVHDYLRVLFARVGVPHCWKCGRPIGSQTPQQITERLMARPTGTRMLVLAPLQPDERRDYAGAIEAVRRDGYARIRVDGKVYDVGRPPRLDRRRRYMVEAVVDRITLRPAARPRVAEAVEAALRLGDGNVAAAFVDDGKEERFSERFACVHCGLSFEPLTPQSFSFNHREGMCPECEGLGVTGQFDESLVLPDPMLSLVQGGCAVWGPVRGTRWRADVEAMARAHGYTADTPVGEWTPEQRHQFLYGSDKEYVVEWRHAWGEGRYVSRHTGVITNLRRRMQATKSEGFRRFCLQFMSELPCSACGGGRLRKESAAVTFHGRSIVDISRMSVAQARDFFDSVELKGSEARIAGEVLQEVRQRLRFLGDVGLHYLSLDRTGATLSGGEAQRIRLASQIGSGLVGVLYILDEPTIGLHQRDTRRLLDTLMRLRDLGNTVLVIEHDPQTIRAADFVVDLGPGAGAEGGCVVATGPPSKIARAPGSVTGRYLSGRERIPVRPTLPRPRGRWLEITGCRLNNLRNLHVRFPLGRLVCVTGVSGSGKSSLVMETLYRALAARLGFGREPPGEHDDLLGLEHIDRAVNVDQGPIGRTPRSNPATYIGALGPIRELFATLPESRRRGYLPGRFSFNRPGGRCEQCEGYGHQLVSLHFLPDVWVLCDACKGRRYNRETLAVKYKRKSIADVLDMTVAEAMEHFANVPSIVRRLRVLDDVGLGYLKLGQSAQTLSVGEAQRVRLARELSQRSTGRTVYILDEPTTGLHPADVRRLLQVLDRLVAAGNTVIVIEHNLDVIKCADYVIDLGPEGGEGGGRIVARGTPGDVARSKRSHTGRFLREVLDA